MFLIRKSTCSLVLGWSRISSTVFFLQHSNLAGGFKCSILHPTLKEDLQFTHMFAMSIVSQPTESNLLKGQGSESLTFVETENKVHSG